MKTFVWPGKIATVNAGTEQEFDAEYRIKADKDLLMKRIALNVFLTGAVLDCGVELQISDIPEMIDQTSVVKYEDIKMLLDYWTSNKAEWQGNDIAEIFEDVDVVLEEDETIYFSLRLRNDHATINFGLGIDWIIIEYLEL